MVRNVDACWDWRMIFIIIFELRHKMKFQEKVEEVG